MATRKKKRKPTVRVRALVVKPKKRPPPKPKPKKRPSPKPKPKKRPPPKPKPKKRPPPKPKPKPKKRPPPKPKRRIGRHEADAKKRARGQLPYRPTRDARGRFTGRGGVTGAIVEGARVDQAEGAPSPRVYKAKPDAQAFPELRFFAHGSQFLGYLEGRPGVLDVLSVVAGVGVEGRTGKTVKDAATVRDVKSRIAELPLVRERVGKERRELRARLYEAWEALDDFGGFAEMEVDGESGGDASA